MTPAVDVVAFVLASLPPAPARVLEIGAGDGALASTLRDAAYDVLAIDPASETADVVAVPLHEVDGHEPFDAAVAVLSLHHVEPLRESCERLAQLVRPGGALVIDEFDVERLDERAARWWLGQRAAAGLEPEHEPSELVRRYREHLHPLARVTGELARSGFALGEPVRGAYLHRWWLVDGLRPAEEQLIASGAIPATGARLVGVR
jgi:SAM-dependent methyltransferase